MIDCVEFVGNMQGVWEGYRSGLVFLGIVASRKSCQDGVLVGIIALLESFGYGICYGGFAGASLSGR